MKYYSVLLIVLGTTLAVGGSKLSRRITGAMTLDAKAKNFLSEPTLDIQSEGFKWIGVLLLSSDSEVGKRSLTEYCNQVSAEMTKLKVTIVREQINSKDKSHRAKLHRLLGLAIDSLRDLATLPNDPNATREDVGTTIARVQMNVDACIELGFEPDPYRLSSEVVGKVSAIHREGPNRKLWAMVFTLPGLVLFVVGLVLGGVQLVTLLRSKSSERPANS